MHTTGGARLFSPHPLLHALFVKAMCAVQLLNTWPTLFHCFMADQAQPVVIIQRQSLEPLVQRLCGDFGDGADASFFGAAGVIGGGATSPLVRSDLRPLLSGFEVTGTWGHRCRVKFVELHRI